MGIQADSFVKERKRIRRITRKTEISRHSIGVGSICIDQIDQTQTNNANQDATITTINKKRQMTRTHAVDISRGSIASQKLQHSQLINFERGRRTVKKLGLKAQQIVMESKHFQSSEDEKAAVEHSIKMSGQIEPQPHHMKEEIQYIKMAEAYEQRDAEEYNNQLKKMKALEEEQSEKLKKSQQQNVKSTKSELAIHQDNEVAGKHPSTPTRQSTERQNSQGIPNINQHQLQAPSAQDDIKDFYQKLLYDSLSQTDMNIDENSIALILEDETIMNMLHKKFQDKNVNNQKEQDDVGNAADAMVEFNPDECEHSLQQRDTLDLELGGPDIKYQKTEQFEYFASDDADSLNLALQGSLLKPIENFGECLSDCTFILQERQSFLNDYGSKCNSNIFDKGQIIKPFGTNMNNSCCSQQPAGNLILNLNLNQNLHNSGFGVAGGNLAPANDRNADEELLKVINQNIQAIPIPKPKKGQKKIQRKRLGGGSVYSAAASEQLVEESVNNCLTPAKLEVGLEEEKQEENNSTNRLKVEPRNQSASKSSSSSLQPGAMTQSSCEDATPKMDKAQVAEDSEIEITINDQSKVVSPIVTARNTGLAPPDAEAQVTQPCAGPEEEKVKEEVDVQVELFKKRQNTKSSIVSTRYKEEQECSMLENSELQPKKVITTSDEDVFGKQKRLKATRVRECSKEKKPEQSRENRDILSNVKELFGGSANGKQRQTTLLNKPAVDAPDALNENDHTKDLTKVDFDLTQLNQTTTPRPEGQQDVGTKEQALVQSNAKFLQEIAFKIEKELKGTKIEKRIEASREYSLSFDVSKDIGRDESIIKQKVDEEKKEPSSEERQLSQQNPLQLDNKSFQYYEPITSSDLEVKHKNAYYPSDQEQSRTKLIPKPRTLQVSQRSGSQSSKGKLKLKIKKLSQSSNGTDMKKISDGDKQDGFQEIRQFQQMPFGSAYTSSDDESKLERNTAKFHPEANNSMQMDVSNPISPDLLRHSISSMKQTPKDLKSPASKALADKLSKIKAPTLLRHKTVKDVSYKGGSATNLSQSNQHSIMTDNSERLRENLSQIKRLKAAKKTQVKQ